MNKPLVLDFDGVVFRNSRALQLVQDRSSAFVERYIPHVIARNLDYRTYGHSVHMLQQHGHTSVTLQDYNEHVFRDRKFLESVKGLVDREDLTRARMWERIILHHGDAHIFSNAPEVWIRCILSFVNLEHVFEDRHMIVPTALNQLKPHTESYLHMMQTMETKKVLFIDDSDLNVNMAKKMGIPSLLYTPEVDQTLMSRFSS